MKILFISSGDAKYGAPNSLYLLMKELKEHHDIEPVLLTKKYNSLNEKCEKINIENHSIWYSDIMAGATYENKALRIIKHLVKYVLYILGKTTKFRVEHIGIDFKSFDIIHTNLNGIDIGAIISEKYRIPHVWHLRVFGKEDYNVVCYKSHCYKYMNEHADRFIAISQGVKESWISKGIAENKIELIYNGIETSKFLKADWKEENSLKIVMSGRIQPNKGQLQLIKAIACLPENIARNVYVDFWGEPYKEYVSELKKSLSECKFETNIRFLGYTSEINKVLKNYHVGINCSKAEGFGLVTVEYMAANLLVIASDTGANPEIIDDNVSGLIYRYGDYLDLAEKIKYVYNNRILSERMAGVGNRIANEKYSIQNTAENVKKIYAELVG